VFIAGLGLGGVEGRQPWASAFRGLKMLQKKNKMPKNEKRNYVFGINFGESSRALTITKYCIYFSIKIVNHNITYRLLHQPSLTDF
jgi:hypothetical protein